MPTAAQQQFVATYGPLSGDIAQATGLDSNVVLGQIAQETGWGAHVPGNNLFGISPGGSIASYPSISAGAQAYVSLIRSRYGKAAQAATPTAQAQALQAGGYNPDPTYGTKVGQIAAEVSTMMPPPAAAAPSSDFAAKWGITPAAGADATASAAQPPPASAAAHATFEQRWGIAPNAPARSVASAPPAAAAPPAASIPDVSYAALSHDLAPAPNTTYGSVLPLAKNNTTGAIRLALPSSLRSLAQGAVDLAYGPTTGTVTPAATNALMAGMTGLTPSPAEGADAAVLGARANPLAVGRATPQNPLALGAPVGGADPLAATASGAAANPGAASGPAAAVAGTPAQEAAEYAAIPEKVPPAPKMPPLTQNAADARADQLIRHFAARPGAPAQQDLVPGFVPTLSQVTNDPGIATLERGVQAAHGGALDIRKGANQQAVNDFTANLVGAPEDIAAAEAERDAVTAPLRDAAFANKAPVDVSPIVEDINKTLAGPDGKRTAVRNTLREVLASLHVGADPSAPLETDPAQLYGTRKNINDMLAPAAQRDKPEWQAAAGNLASIKDQLDGAIEQGAPGFKDYVAQYAGLSRPIDSMQYLQGLDLTDQAGNVRGASVDRAIKSIRKLQRAPGANKAGSITEDTMDQLQRLHRTLQTARYSDTAGKALGSNTFQNLATNSRVGAVAGNPLIHLGMAGAGSLVGGAPGAMLGATLDMAGKGVAGRAESMTRNALVERLLNLNGKGVAALGAPKQ